MTQQKLIDLGAECVGGDLILERVTVGRYRNGGFSMTEEGAALLEQKQADAEAEADLAAATGRQRSAPAKRSTKKVTPASDEVPGDGDGDGGPAPDEEKA